MSSSSSLLENLLNKFHLIDLKRNFAFNVFDFLSTFQLSFATQKRYDRLCTFKLNCTDQIKFSSWEKSKNCYTFPLIWNYAIQKKKSLFCYNHNHYDNDCLNCLMSKFYVVKETASVAVITAANNTISWRKQHKNSVNEAKKTLKHGYTGEIILRRSYSLCPSLIYSSLTYYSFSAITIFAKAKFAFEVNIHILHYKDCLLFTVAFLCYF